jgi:hypothetical protein
VKSKNLLLLIVFLAVIFLVLVPYVRFVVQRQGLDTDLARISLEISEDTNSKRVTVEIRYEAEFSLFFIPRTEKVVLRNDFYILDL